MSDSAVASLGPVTGQRESWIRGLRLASGLVLFSFVALHLVNHALALISMETADRARPILMALWRNPIGAPLLLTAALTHIALALTALYRRRSLAMPVKEAAQLLLGLAIPILIAEHVIGTNVYDAAPGGDATYAYVANALWVQAPMKALRQAFALLTIWSHGCLGIFFWLRYRPWFPKVAPLLLVVATLLPILALLGFVNAGRFVEAAGITGTEGVAPAAVDAARAITGEAATGVYWAYGSVLSLVLAARLVRARRENRSTVVITYASGKQVRVPVGHSVLEASRLAGIPHHAACGGRGRCSTCRVRVLNGHGLLPPASEIEATTLARIRAEPDVRLACQLRPSSNVKVAPILGPSQNLAAVPAAAPGRERDVAVLFCDIRGFTALSDSRLPFDTVFLLNRYFAVVGSAVERSGGRLDKFIGDGAMAIFGLSVPKEEACRQALSTAALIVRDIRSMSDDLTGELRQPLRVAIGIHFGPAIAGTMGYGRVMGVTVIGDTVNVASRLEAIAKDLDMALVVSDDVLATAGLTLAGADRRTVDIRGRAAPLDVHVAHGQTLLDLVQ